MKIFQTWLPSFPSPEFGSEQNEVQHFSRDVRLIFYLCGRETKKIYLDSRNHSWKNHFGHEQSPFCKLKIFRNCYFLWLQNWIKVIGGSIAAKTIYLKIIWNMTPEVILNMFHLGPPHVILTRNPWCDSQELDASRADLKLPDRCQVEFSDGGMVRISFFFLFLL